MLEQNETPVLLAITAVSTSVPARSLFQSVVVLFIIAWPSSFAKAEAPGVTLWPRIKIGSEVYTDVVYINHDASRVKFRHAFGIANIPISDLPSSLQEELNFDPNQAAENETRLAAEQQAIRAKVESDIEAARERRDASPNSAEQPVEKDGMIRVMDTEIIPPNEVQRLGISGLQKYRQPGESPLQQMDRERKTGVIKKVWKWVSKPKITSNQASRICVFRTEYGRKGRLIEIIEDGNVYEVERGRKGRLIEIMDEC